LLFIVKLKALKIVLVYLKINKMPSPRSFSNHFEANENNKKCTLTSMFIKCYFLIKLVGDEYNLYMNFAAFQAQRLKRLLPGG
jgi:hypothetical protein